MNIIREVKEIINLRVTKVYCEPSYPPVVHEVDEHQEGGSVDIDHNHREEGRGASLESVLKRLASSFVVA